MTKKAHLLVDTRGPEIQHRAGITAPDAFIYLAPDGGVPTVFFDAREFAVQKAKLDRLQNGVAVKRLEPYVARAGSHLAGSLVAILLVILEEYNVGEVLVSPSLPYAIGQALKEMGKIVTVYSFAAEREHKTAQEVEYLLAAQRVNESAFELAWQILTDSEIRNQQLIYQGNVLTSEFMKSQLRKHLLDQGYDCPDGIIVASGEQTARPHDEGTGPLKPHECIIIDIFPRSETTGYVADMTRTFVKGESRKEINELFSAVEKVQKEVAENVQVGDRCAAVHQRAVEGFARLQHPTSPEKGFMHSTGHSLGLAVHESPAFSARSDQVVEPGMVFTVEPGLYYPGVGGVRIEDVIIFHPDGRKENITRFEKPCFIL